MILRVIVALCLQESANFTHLVDETVDMRAICFHLCGAAEAAK